MVVVIDACGVGALPDAAEYGDEGADTLVHVAEAVGGLELPTLAALGLGSIVALEGVPVCGRPVHHGRLRPLGPGKDSITGHWELMGVVMDTALPTYPDGFPEEIVSRLRRRTGRELICNRPDDGVTAIEQFGDEHLQGGALILYTSQDSVLQLAAHVDRIAPDELYAVCAAVREEMAGEHAVGRVIARPFAGESGSFARTDGRRDYALAPPGRSYLQELEAAGVEVHGVGKIGDLFAGVGVTRSHPGASNEEALAGVGELVDGLDEGLIFANLIETDQTYGHRGDVAGFASALAGIDSFLAGTIPRLRESDLLMVTADHGVDPAVAGTDHTREYAPLLAASGRMLRAGGEAGRRHDGLLADVGATAMRWLTGRRPGPLPGRPILS